MTFILRFSWVRTIVKALDCREEGRQIHNCSKNYVIQSNLNSMQPCDGILCRFMDRLMPQENMQVLICFFFSIFYLLYKHWAFLNNYFLCGTSMTVLCIHRNKTSIVDCKVGWELLKLLCSKLKVQRLNYNLEITDY